MPSPEMGAGRAIFGCWSQLFARRRSRVSLSDGGCLGFIPETQKKLSLGFLIVFLFFTPSPTPPPKAEGHLKRSIE